LVGTMSAVIEYHVERAEFLRNLPQEIAVSLASYVTLLSH
jgi:hypothetical protein